MGTNTTRSLWGKLRSKEYREAFVDSTIGNVISAQIFAIRKKLGWSQGDLAAHCDMAQARISVMENPDYRNFSLNTLKRLAAAFDVALLVRFVPYSELVRWTQDESRQSLAVPSYDEDAAREARSTRVETRDTLVPPDVIPAVLVGIGGPYPSIQGAPPLLHPDQLQGRVRIVVGGSSYFDLPRAGVFSNQDAPRHTTPPPNYH